MKKCVFLSKVNRFTVHIFHDLIWFTIILHLNKGSFSKWPYAQVSDWSELFFNKDFGRPQRGRSLVSIRLFLLR